MGAVSLVGSPGTMALLALVVSLLLAVRRRWLILTGWVVAFVGGGILNWSLKQIIHRPRPADASMFLHRFSYSFPSGHAMGAVFGYGMLAYIIVTFSAERRSIRAAVIVATVLLVLLIGLSRLYLGVHYFSDVVGGYAAGVLWLAACISGVEVARRQPKPGPLVE